MMYPTAGEAIVRVRKTVGLKARTMLFASYSRKLRSELNTKAGMNECVTGPLCFVIRSSAGP